MRIIIDKDLCCGSGACIVVCPENAITLQDGKAVLNEKICDLDGLCIPACPNGAIGYEEDDSPGGCGF